MFGSVVTEGRKAVTLNGKVGHSFIHSFIQRCVKCSLWLNVTEQQKSPLVRIKGSFPSETNVHTVYRLTEARIQHNTCMRAGERWKSKGGRRGNDHRWYLRCSAERVWRIKCHKNWDIIAHAAKIQSLTSSTKTGRTLMNLKASAFQLDVSWDSSWLSLTDLKRLATKDGDVTELQQVTLQITTAWWTPDLCADCPSCSRQAELHD